MQSTQVNQFVVFAGDSITSASALNGVQGNLSMVGAAAIGAYPVGAITPTDRAYVDAGVGGNTSSQLLARFDIDVIAKSPKLVHILIGTNDASAIIPVSTLASNIRAMVSRCRSIGARVILGTVPPNGTGSSANRKALIVAYNQWICRYALSEQLLVADYYSILVDNTNGNFLPLYDSGDATHPSYAGTGAMVMELREALSRGNNSTFLLLTKDANDPNNWARNALFLSAFGTDWSLPSGGGVTTGTVSGDSSIKGNWGKITASSTSAVASSYQNVTTNQGWVGYLSGHWFMFACRMQCSALSLGQHLSARLRHNGVGTSDHSTKYEKFIYTGNGGLIFIIEGSSPVGAIGVQSEFEIGIGTGDIQVSQFTTYDLIAMGVTNSTGSLV